MSNHFHNPACIILKRKHYKCTLPVGIFKIIIKEILIHVDLLSLTVYWPNMGFGGNHT